jgi:hypothetical protein
LPKIPIPLEDPDPDVFLDLAEIFALAYQRGRYARLINYDRPLDLPLHPRTRSGPRTLRAEAQSASARQSGRDRVASFAPSPHGHLIAL